MHCNPANQHCNPPARLLTAGLSCRGHSAQLLSLYNRSSGWCWVEGVRGGGRRVWGEAALLGSSCFLEFLWPGCPKVILNWDTGQRGRSHKTLQDRTGDFLVCRRNQKKKRFENNHEKKKKEGDWQNQSDKRFKKNFGDNENVWCVCEAVSNDYTWRGLRSLWFNDDLCPSSEDRGPHAVIERMSCQSEEFIAVVGAQAVDEQRDVHCHDRLAQEHVQPGLVLLPC